MSAACGVPVIECLYVLACGRYLCKRCCHSGARDSTEWEPASSRDFQDVPRMCRMVLAVYEEDLTKPRWAPAGGYRIDVNSVVKRVDYTETRGTVPTYLIYVDHNAEDIVLAVRGLSLIKEEDYAVLLDNKIGQESFDGGYVHHGLLQAAKWLLNKESETLSRLVVQNPSYTLTFAGHSLGSGVAAMLAMLVAKFGDKVGNISRERIRCYAIAPSRCMSLNLAVRHADIIQSVILQDDFLPRTVTPLEDIFKSMFCLPCLLCSRCTKDTIIPEKRMLEDPRRLYAPGRVYHVVDRKPCGCGRYPPVVRTAVPVEGRFEHVVLSCNATSDHSVVWIEKESQKALELMIEKEKAMEIPTEQKMGRQETFQEQHEAALHKAASLQVPNAFQPQDIYDSHQFNRQDEENADVFDKGSQSGSNNSLQTHGRHTRENKNEAELSSELAEKDDSGKPTLKNERDR